MPLKYQEGTAITLGERDLIYGLDTGQLKLRFYFFNNYIKDQKLGIWDGHKLDQHKIDYLTQSMGPTPPEAWATKIGTASFKDGSALSTQKRSPQSALPGTWASGSATNDFRDADRADFIKWIQTTRYTPGDSANPYQWNARFKRTSKAGLFWALFQKGYNVHFIVSNKMDYRDVVDGSKSARGHKFAQYHARYPTQDAGTDTVEVEEKRITYAELRWVFRYQDYASVSQQVQFWEDLSSAQEFKAVPAPWNQVGTKADAWKAYVPKFKDKPEDKDDMAVFMKAVKKDDLPTVTQKTVSVTCDNNGTLKPA